MYRFELGGWELISLNSETPHEPGSRQLGWLDRAPTGRPAPAASPSGTGRASAPAALHGDAPDIAPFWRSLSGRARLVLNGHDHVMMRYRRRAGLTEYIAGTGGGVRYGLNPDGRAAFARSDLTGACG